jgi:ABC-type transport system involved in cytochrome c biogenesis permease subunit
MAYLAMVLGWSLFTIGLVTGLIWGIDRAAHGANEQRLFFGPKILLAVGVWVVYALALHTPISPNVRGRKAAVLSLIGLVLMAGTLIAVQFMPGAAQTLQGGH